MRGYAQGFRVEVDAPFFDDIPVEQVKEAQHQGLAVARFRSEFAERQHFPVGFDDLVAECLGEVGHDVVVERARAEIVFRVGILPFFEKHFEHVAQVFQRVGRNLERGPLHDEEMQIERKRESGREKEELGSHDGISFEVLAYRGIEKEEFGIDDQSLPAFERVLHRVHAEMGFPLEADDAACHVPSPDFFGVEDVGVEDEGEKSVLAEDVVDVYFANAFGGGCFFLRFHGLCICKGYYSGNRGN